MSDTLPDNAGYVAAAYLVFLALLLIYLAIAAVRAQRFERDLAELHERLDERDGAGAAEPASEEAVAASVPQGGER